MIVKVSRAVKLAVLSYTLVLPLHAAAEFKIMVGVDPADDDGRRNLAFAGAIAPSLTAALGTRVLHKQTTNLTDVMRASRTQENDALIGPPHVTASAISHNFELLARDSKNANYVLVARKDIPRLEDMAGKRLYLTQQDSVRTYLAKGLLVEAGFDIKKFKQVVYGKTSGAGMLALATNLADVTIAEQEEAQDWIKSNPGIATILKSTRKVPAGTAVMVRKGLPESDRKSLLKWLHSSEAGLSGFGKMQVTTEADDEQYRYIASLGILTPSALAGATVVGADEVARLLASGATPVDTRTAKEYENEHIPGAVHAPYMERSLKDRDFDAALDDYSAITKLPRDKPLIFFCNGPECWKSYKASKIAVEKGFKQVYWYRKGMPEWREKSKPAAGAKFAAK
jgi:rhodanese-related sulfurtransferase/ABC-type phosphate/phosphonate transport system substrate-binding protein